MMLAEVPRKWDHEADVIIVGGGTTGLPAAIKVAETGLKATVLETRPQCGGSLSMIVGGCSFAGTDEQKAAGVDDSPDILYQEMLDVAGSDPKLARAYADNQLEAYRMLKDQGLPVWVAGSIGTGKTRRRGQVGPTNNPGPTITRAFEDRARSRGAEILFKHRARRLITDPKTGKVIGLKVTVGDEEKNFKAKRAVILGTGGFGYNREMVAEYAPHMVNCVPKMPVGHQGDGLKMALDVGAATKDIAIAVAGSWPVDIETHSRAIWALDWGGIMVNVHGKRFCDESSSEGFYGRMTEAGMRQPGSVYWVVFDEAIKNNVGMRPGYTDERKDHIHDIERCKKYKADIVEDLAKQASIDVEGLKETITRFNGDIDSVGYDTEFGRKFQLGKARALEKLSPPFYVVKCVTSTTSMKGGLKINEHCQVINNYGEVIPGLYAGGEVTGGLYTKSYILGTMTTFSMAHGIIAGRNAAKEPEFKYEQ